MAVVQFSYSIKYPGNGNISEEENEKNTFEIINKSEAEGIAPVIVLLGWTGCKERYLSKYSAIYEKKGYITVNVIVPPKILYFQSHKTVDIAESLLDILKKKNLVSHPIIFHMFSNGGCMVYSQMSILLNSNNNKYCDCLNVRGVIIDSAPGKVRLFTAVSSFMATIQTSAAMRYFLGLCLLTYLFTLHMLFTWLPIDLSVMTPNMGLYERMCEDLMECPQLFLYSKSDLIICHDHIEEAAQRREDRGVTVKKLCWDDTAHCGHLRVHPEVYSHACLDFVHTCLIAPAKSML